MLLPVCMCVLWSPQALRVPSTTSKVNIFASYIQFYIYLLSICNCSGPVAVWVEKKVVIEQLGEIADNCISRVGWHHLYWNASHVKQAATWRKRRICACLRPLTRQRGTIAWWGCIAMIVQVRSRIALKGDESTALGLMEQQQQPVDLLYRECTWSAAAASRECNWSLSAKGRSASSQTWKKLVVCVKVDIWLY